MRELKGLGNKKYLNTYSKIHQIASAAGKLASKISGNFSASRQKVLLSWMWPVERSKKTLRASESIGALTFGECALSHDLHPHISLTTDSLSLSWCINICRLMDNNESSKASWVCVSYPRSIITVWKMVLCLNDQLDDKWLISFHFISIVSWSWVQEKTSKLPKKLWCCHPARRGKKCYKRVFPKRIITKCPSLCLRRL